MGRGFWFLGRRRNPGLVDSNTSGGQQRKTEHLSAVSVGVAITVSLEIPRTSVSTAPQACFRNKPGLRRGTCSLRISLQQRAVALERPSCKVR